MIRLEICENGPDEANSVCENNPRKCILQVRDEAIMDILSQNENKEDFEDGELPEDGEICDDEDDVQQTSTRQETSSSVELPTPSAAAVQPSGSSGRDSRESRSERPRRFENDGPPIRDTDPFGPGEPEANEYFGGDKDYRSVNASEEEPFSDTDYRVNRRRRHSPAHDDGEHEGRSKRPFFGRGAFRGGGGGGSGGGGGGFRNGQKPRFQTDHQICKFFREGYCRDGDNCSYSHQAEDSLRRPVLCNFYANSFCKKGLQCLMLHGEFPCKDFHKGHCKSDQCRFSHVPLTDYTRPIVEKLMADEDQRQPPTYRQNPVANAAAAAAAANVMPRRRVLLPDGPNTNASSPPHAPIIHAPVPQPNHLNGGQLPPPAVVVPTIQRNPMYPPVGTGGYFNSGPRPEQVKGLPPPRTIEPPRPSTHMQQHLQQPGLVQPQLKQQERRSPPPFNLEAMLNKLANGDRIQDLHTVDDSPASPPPLNFGSSLFSTNRVAVIPKEVQTTWGLVRTVKRLPYSNIENVEKIPANDPRKAKALAKQFDAFSSILSAGGSVVSDPRLRAQKEQSESVRRPQNTMPFSSWMPQIS